MVSVPVILISVQRFNGTLPVPAATNHIPVPTSFPGLAARTGAIIIRASGMASMTFDWIFIQRLQ